MLEFKIGHLAETLGIHRNTVRNWIKTDRLKARPALAKKYVIDKVQFKLCLISLGVSEYKIDDLISDYDAISKPKGQRVQRRSPEFIYKTSLIKKEVPMTTQPLGSVTVVGGGIAGIQAAIDLADSGYYVYLIEKSPGIGGGMAKLDKTFPTNDCAM